jgi:protein-L-isoaspartate O-methyltransferase
MAWLSVGTSNEELCEKLVENGVIRSQEILRAFSCTDRGDFVQPEFRSWSVFVVTTPSQWLNSSWPRSQAYLDRPFKQGIVHISAPHMYATVLEALELEGGSGLSFLNVGSGSGYLSCLAAALLGECGLSHGIDINPQLVKYSERSCKVIAFNA